MLLADLGGTSMSARQRAAAAFAELDLIDRHCTSSRYREDRYEARKDNALRHLADAMTAEFGPLPTEPRRVMRVVSWKPKEEDMDCAECAGTGLQDGPDGAPCDWCSGTGLW
jgi:hypothetical protein